MESAKGSQRNSADSIRGERGSGNVSKAMQSLGGLKDNPDSYEWDDAPPRPVSNSIVPTSTGKAGAFSANMSLSKPIHHIIALCVRYGIYTLSTTCMKVLMTGTEKVNAKGAMVEGSDVISLNTMLTHWSHCVSGGEVLGSIVVDAEPHGEQATHHRPDLPPNEG